MKKQLYTLELPLKLLFSTLVILIAFTSNSQKSLKCSANPIYLFDESTDQFTCLDDSFEIIRFDNKRKEWKKTPITFISKEAFSKFKIEFIPISIKSQGLFFVHCSGGEVYQLKNDTLNRIDHSFKHRNKYYGALFTFQNEIYNFGGYGLFRDNNTLIKFDTLKHEWLEILSNFNMPNSRHSFLYHNDSNGFYIIGGFSTLGAKTKTNNDVWFFNFSNAQWQKKGEIDSFWLKNIMSLNHEKNILHYPILSKYCHGENYLEMDFRNNQYKVFRNNLYQGDYHYCFDQSESKVMFLVFSSGNQTFDLIITKSHLLKGKLLHEGMIWHEKHEKSNTWIFIVAGLLIIAVGFVLFRLMKKHKTLNFHLEREKFSEREWDLLLYFNNQNDRRVEMSKISDIVDESGISYDTLKKRRETLIKDLRLKISEVTGLSPEDVFIIHNHPNDKRSKILELNKLIQL